jgi:hypothetical protein
MLYKKIQWRSHCNCVRGDNLYKINYIKMHWADAANLVQFLTEDNIFELEHCHLTHLNVKDVHTLQNMVSDIYHDKFSFLHHRCFYKVCIEGK